MLEPNKPNSIIVVMIVIGLLAAAVGGTVYVLGSDNGNNVFAINNDDGSGGQKNNITNVKHLTYKDGTYTQKATYISPGGKEGVEVEVTLKDNIITDATFTPRPFSVTSEQYQDDFKNGYKTKVVGKNIDEVKLSRVAGSSLTSTGFNDAITQIKDSAKA